MGYEEILRGLTSKALARKFKIDTILASEYGAQKPLDAVLQVLDDSFCMHGRPVAGYYRQKEDSSNDLYFERIDGHEYPWRIVKHDTAAGFRWWFSTSGGRDLRYTIPFASVVTSPAHESMPPASGWSPYSATCVDHVLLMGSDVRVQPLGTTTTRNNN